MSKADAQRAMREANYARQQASRPTPRQAAAPGETQTSPAVRKASPKPVRADKAAPSTPDAQDDLCGHKSMNNRACTRDKGHSEKSHRYT